MPVHFEKWSCHFHNDIMAKSIKLRNIRFFAEVKRKAAYIAILRVGRHPDFMSYFVGFAGMYCLKKSLPLNAIIPSSIERF